MMTNTILKSFAASCAIALITGCSGGGSESPTREISSRIGTTEVAVAEAVSRHEPISEHCGDPVEINTEMLNKINELRASSRVCRGRSFPAVAPLELNPQLENAAIVHADDMATTDFLSHTGSDGSDSGDRADRQNYDWSYISENLAGNFASVDAVAAAWMASDTGHCEVIMAAKAKELGAACIYNEESAYEIYWALEVGAK